MKQNVLIFLLAAFILFVGVSYYHNWNVADGSIPQNDNITHVQNFAISTDDPDCRGLDYKSLDLDFTTTMAGSIFIQDNNGNVKAVVAAQIEVGKEDKGEILIRTKRGWKITKLLSSYPDDGDLIEMKNETAIFESLSGESGYLLLIGGHDYSKEANTDRVGTLVLELEYDKTLATTEHEFSLFITLGTIDTSTSTTNISEKTVTVPITQSF